MATSTQARPAVAVDRFTASEPGAWSNSYLLNWGVADRRCLLAASQSVLDFLLLQAGP
jgi:hypothetical protein